MLDERIRTTLSLLIATQQKASGRSTASQRRSRRTPWPIGAGAGRQGRVRCAERVLDSALSGSAAPPADQESDLDTKAIVLHALAISGKGDFALANHLLRDRKLLSPLERAYLALALMHMDRKETAAEVMSGWSTGFSRNAAETPPKGGTPAGDVEAQAVTALALLGLDPASSQAKV